MTVSDEQQAQDVEAVAFARREACADVVAALVDRVAWFEAVFASPGWAALAAWFAGRPEQKVRELEAERDRLIGDVTKLIAMNERMTGEGAELEAALAAAEAQRDKTNNDRGLLIQTQRALTERAVAAEARCTQMAAAYDRLADWYTAVASRVPSSVYAELGWTIADTSRQMLEVMDTRRAALGDAGGGTGEVGGDGGSR